MLTLIIHQLAESDAVRRLHQAIRNASAGDRVSVAGVTGSLDALLLAGIYRTFGRQMVVLGPDREICERLRDDLTITVGQEAVAFFGGKGRAGQTADRGSDLRVIRALGTGERVIVLAPVTGLLERLPTPATVPEKTFTLNIGETHPLNAVVGRLNELGLAQKDFVEVAGDFALRGGILDIFPHAADNPVRIEFLGDTIESIREFEPLSQRSIRTLNGALIMPDLLADPAPGSQEPEAHLPDYLDPDCIVVQLEPERLRGALQEVSGEETEAVLRSAGSGHILIALESVSPHRDAIDIGSKPQPAFNGSIPILRKALSAYRRDGYAVTLLCDGHAETARLRDLLSTGPFAPEPETEGEPAPLDLGELEFLSESLHEGFVVDPLQRVYFTEHQIFNRLRRRGRRRAPKFRGLTEKEFQLLRRGDYVVHEDYGIGKFEGLKRIQVQGSEQEVVALQYEGNDRLYVNLNSINKLQKYSSTEGHIPSLTRLGSSEWDRLKSRAKKKVKDIARELIRLYAQRKSLPGHAFQVDTPWQKELEASFMYEDTFDQAKATREVKDDMQAAWPMDRLICGDVGFGKTEVAIRAAFKAVLDGKQVAILVPTTILAMQHYNTFADRTSKYGLHIEVLSRFKSKRDQASILSRLAAGGVDIVIGTHRLLSKDVAFKNLGLLVIDEEHRFGVAAKEKLRQMRVTVDTLALTATPIPRTLHFSLLGARDLSLIATAPRNRRPVQTELLEWDDGIIREAVLREMGRGGQVFFVHDRIQNIEQIVARLLRILPGMRIRSAHGQLPSHQLEEVMLEFLERKLDVLVATKIIESGLDMPNVNTMIINRADRFGMAELYQLRGRVGRSNVQAYAYLLTPGLSTVPQATLRRLQAVEEFTELGSGFNLAMRDLEIRGAGNLLGSEQSGFIENMGFETYTRILEQAVRELKEEDFKELFQKELAQPVAAETVVEPEFDAFIPAHYVGNDAERLSIYRRLYRLSTAEQLQEVAEELKDRFGPLPQETENLFGVVTVRLQAARYRFRRVRLSMETMELEFPPTGDAAFYDGEQFQRLMGKISVLRGHGARLHQDDSTVTLSLRLPRSSTPSHAMLHALELLRNLVSTDTT